MRTRRVLTPLVAVAALTPLAISLPGGSMLLAILGIGFLIFVHEWGHFAACRLTGTRTETFAIGFGPRLFGWEKDRDGKRRFTVGQRQLDPDDHAMDFRISAIPLGGYVKMAGELPGEESATGAPDEFPQKSAAQRAFIISAGVFMNLVTAIVLYGLTYTAGRSVGPAVVGTVEAGGAAWQAGIQAGDRVVSINGKRIENDIDLLMESALSSKSEPARVVVLRDGREHEFRVQARHDPEHGRMRMHFSVAGVHLALGRGDGDLSIGGRSPETHRERVLGKGHGVLTIGADRSVTIDGVEVRGARAAQERIERRLAAGRLPVVVELDGERREIAPLAPRPPREPSAVAPRFVGIEPLHTVQVGLVLDAAARTLSTGDVLRAPLGADGEPLTEPGSAAGWLRAADDEVAWTGLLLERNGESTRVSLSLPTAADRLAFLDAVQLKDLDDGGARPATRSGALVPVLDEEVETTWWYRVPASSGLDLVPGERIRRVGPKDVTTFAEATAVLRTMPLDKPAAIDLVAADGTRRTIQATLRPGELVGEQPFVLEHATEVAPAVGPVAGLSRGAERTWREVVNTFRTIGSFFTGSVSFRKNVGGPIAIVDASSSAATRGFLQLLWFMAYVSVMLAVLNILPIPVLDGGHLLFILIEKIKGSPLSDTTMLRMQKIGMMLLLALMVFAFWNDIHRLITRT